MNRTTHHLQTIYPSMYFGVKYCVCVFVDFKQVLRTELWPQSAPAPTPPLPSRTGEVKQDSHRPLLARKCTHTTLFYAELFQDLHWISEIITATAIGVFRNLDRNLRNLTFAPEENSPL